MLHGSRRTAKFIPRWNLCSPGLGLDLWGQRIEKSREAVHQQKAIEKKLELNPESRA